MNVFVVLLLGILSAGIIGIIDTPTYNLVSYSKDIYSGFLSVNEVILLSLFISGLIYLVPKQSFSQIIKKIYSFNLTAKMSQLIIAALASISDILLANNTIAILATGDAAKKIADNSNIQPHKSAFLLDSFACIFQGIIPHGAQIILASSLSGIAPFALSSKVFFCYIMAAVILLYITCDKKKI